MSEEPIEGQESDSPTDNGAKAGESPPSATDQILKAAEEGSEQSAGSEKESEAKEGSEENLPFDKHPKWQSARKAEATLQKIMSKHGFESAEEMAIALDSGKTITELLGNKDAQKLIEDANELAEIKKYWADQEALKKEEEEEPSETVERLKREKEELEETYKQKEAREAKERELSEALDNFDVAVESTVEKLGLEGEAAEMAKLFLGVDNPFNEVDITDSGAVKAMASTGAEKFSKFLANVRQQAIDDYAKGKSEIAPISKSDGEATPSVAKKTDTSNLSVDEVFGAARNELMEIITAAEQSS